ncbi:MAG: hypothetical protein Tsb006_8180 [Rickettsiaceae bacterium]
MSLSLAQLSKLLPSQKVEFIRNNAPGVLRFLRQDITELNSSDLSNLLEFINLEQLAQGLTENLTTQLTGFLSTFSNGIDSEVKKLGLSASEEKLVDNIFKKTILLAATKASAGLDQNIQSEQSILYSYLLSEKTADILDGILEFKKQIDSHFPGASDQILSAAVPVIITLVSIYSPPAGLLLKHSGILTAATKFLQTDNLEKTVTRMYQKLDEIQEDNKLKEIHETGTKVTEIAENLGIQAPTLSKFNFSLSSARETLQEITQNDHSKRFLKAVADYARTHIPTTPEEIDTKLSLIQQNIFEELKKHNIPTELAKKTQAIISGAMTEAETKIKKSINTGSAILTKVTHVLSSSEVLKEAANRVGSLATKAPSHAPALQNIARLFTEQVDKHIRGDVRAIAEQMVANSKATPFARKILGVGLASELAIKKAVLPNEQGRGA